MLLRIAIFMVMAAGLTGFGLVAWISLHPSGPGATAVAPAVTVHVLAAARTLRPGTLLKPDDVTAISVNQSAVPEGARRDTLADRAELLGAMIRHPVLAGEVILPIQVMRAGDRGFLAAVLGPGMRAATVGVDAVSGTAGLIWPGDYVDLILTQTIDDPALPQGRRIAGETVLHGVRVIAIDQELMQGATAASAQSVYVAAQTRTVTLEVTPDNAERIAVATRLGRLSLSVISADPQTNWAKSVDTAVSTDHQPVTWAGDVSSALQNQRKTSGSSTPGLHLYEGNAEGKEFRFP